MLRVFVLLLAVALTWKAAHGRDPCAHLTQDCGVHRRCCKQACTYGNYWYCESKSYRIMKSECTCQGPVVQPVNQPVNQPGPPAHAGDICANVTSSCNAHRSCCDRVCTNGRRWGCHYGDGGRVTKGECKCWVPENQPANPPVKPINPPIQTTSKPVKPIELPIQPTYKPHGRDPCAHLTQDCGVHRRCCKQACTYGNYWYCESKSYRIMKSECTCQGPVVQPVNQPVNQPGPPAHAGDICANVTSSCNAHRSCCDRVCTNGRRWGCHYGDGGRVTKGECKCWVPENQPANPPVKPINPPIQTTSKPVKPIELPIQPTYKPHGRDPCAHLTQDCGVHRRCCKQACTYGNYWYCESKSYRIIKSECTCQGPVVQPVNQPVNQPGPPAHAGDICANVTSSCNAHRSCCDRVCTNGRRWGCHYGDGGRVTKGECKCWVPENQPANPPVKPINPPIQTTSKPVKPIELPIQPTYKPHGRDPCAHLTQDCGVHRRCCKQACTYGNYWYCESKSYRIIKSECTCQGPVVQPVNQPVNQPGPPAHAGDICANVTSSCNAHRSCCDRVCTNGRRWGCHYGDGGRVTKGECKCWVPENQPGNPPVKPINPPIQTTYKPVKPIELPIQPTYKPHGRDPCAHLTQDCGVHRRCCKQACTYGNYWYCESKSYRIIKSECTCQGPVVQPVNQPVNQPGPPAHAGDICANVTSSCNAHRSCCDRVCTNGRRWGCHYGDGGRVTKGECKCWVPENQPANPPVKPINPPIQTTYKPVKPIELPIQPTYKPHGRDPCAHLTQDCGVHRRCCKQACTYGNYWYCESKSYRIIKSECTCQGPVVQPVNQPVNQPGPPAHAGDICANVTSSCNAHRSCCDRVCTNGRRWGCHYGDGGRVTKGECKCWVPENQPANPPVKPINPPIQPTYKPVQPIELPIQPTYKPHGRDPCAHLTQDCGVHRRCCKQACTYGSYWSCESKSYRIIKSECTCQGPVVQPVNQPVNQPGPPAHAGDICANVTSSCNAHRSCCDRVCTNGRRWGCHYGDGGRVTKGECKCWVPEKHG